MHWQWHSTHPLQLQRRRRCSAWQWQWWPWWWGGKWWRRLLHYLQRQDKAQSSNKPKHQHGSAAEDVTKRAILNARRIVAATAATAVTTVVGI